VCLRLKEYWRFTFKVSLGKPSRREGSLEASHTSAMLIYYFALIFAVHPSHFQLAYIGLDRSKILLNLYFVLWKVLVPKGQGFP
jgi:hypothetical protein